MKTYLTFGQTHTHTLQGNTLDKDIVMVIHSNTWEEARKKAFDLFNGVFATTYSEEDWKYVDAPRHFYRGYIHLYQNGDLIREPHPEEL